MITGQRLYKTEEEVIELREKRRRYDFRGSTRTHVSATSSLAGRTTERHYPVPKGSHIRLIKGVDSQIRGVNHQRHA